jgi:2-polyprenyl-3-methyl-5-hydroxy-6-metoxy-1,4-benzoquinol methylase
MTYNRYIFNKETNEIINDFEGAYKNFEVVYSDQFDCSRSKFSFIKGWLHDRPKSSVLDIGAGYGCYVNNLYRNGIDVLGLEVSQSAINRGKEMYGADLPLIKGDISEPLQLKQKFDIIICYGVLGWALDKIDQILRQINECLAANGKVAFSIGFSDNHTFFRDILPNDIAFAKLINKYFLVTDFFVHYLNKNSEHPFQVTEVRDLIVLGEKFNDHK